MTPRNYATGRVFPAHAGMNRVTSGVSRLDVLGDAWGLLRRALEQGTPYAEWKAAAAQTLEAAWGQARPWHLETIFRTNVQSSYSAGRWAQLSDPDVRQARPYWMYDAPAVTRWCFGNAT